ALFAATSACAPRIAVSPSSTPSQISVVGALRTASGLGQSARLCIQALRAVGYDVAGIDIGKLFMQPENLPDSVPKEHKRLGPGVLILHVNAPLVPLALCWLGKKFIQNKYIVGYWAWELPAVVPDWRAGAKSVNDVWVPSRFTAEAVRPL